MLAGRGTSKPFSNKHTVPPSPRRFTLKGAVVTPLSEFYHDSLNLLRRCNKPDRKEFMRVMTATGIGFLVMGGLGFLAKLIHIRESAGDLGAARLLGRRRARSPGLPDAQSSLRAIAVSTCLPSSPRTHPAVNKILVGA